MTGSGSAAGACYLVVSILLVVMTACTGAYRNIDTSGEGGKGSSADDSKVTVDAYLFDTKTYRDGKPTSIRLEVFWTDSVIALGGRAYLGKGALKGCLTRDSAIVFFPSRNEYIREPMSGILTSQDCAFPLEAFDILSLFHASPDSVSKGDELTVEANHENQDRPRFTVTGKDCDWWLQLEYVLGEESPQIRRFEFSDGEHLQITANLRELRRNRRVNASKFKIDIPPGAAKITP